MSNAIWDDAKGVLGTVAPLLATAVGGPLAGTATRVIISALGLNADTPAPAVVQAVQSANSDQLVALKKANDDFAVQIRQLGVDEAKLSFDDLSNARGRQIALKDETPGVLAYSIVVGYFGMLGMLSFVNLPVANQQPLLMLVGGLSALVGMVGNYYFGSSKSQLQSTQALANSVPVSAALSLTGTASSGS
jgi:hypothetical protein